MNRENVKYLKLLKQNYASSQSVIREIINLSAITNLPKGTEFFLSDIHGEYEAFLHIMNNCSGVIKEKVDLIFTDTLSEFDRQELCTLIYYPMEKMTMLAETGKIGQKSERHCLRTTRILSTSFYTHKRMKIPTRSAIIGIFYKQS